MPIQIQAADNCGEYSSIRKGVQSADCVRVENIILSVYCGMKRMATSLCRYVSDTMAKQWTAERAETQSSMQKQRSA